MIGGLEEGLDLFVRVLEVKPKLVDPGECALEPGPG